MFFALMGFSAFAQTCEILLYTTDFSGWGPANGGSSNRFETIPGISGWEREGGIRINDGTPGVSTGSSNRRLRSPQFEFYGMATVIVEIGDVTNTGRNLQINGNAQNITAAGTYTYSFPASGNQSLEFTFSNGGFFIKRITICTDPGATPFVAATNYTRAPGAGHSMQGAVGGAANSGTAVNDPVNIKGWNITADVILSIEGPDASKFSFVGANPDGTLTVANAAAIAAAGYDVPLQFTPSVREGMASATLVITNPQNPAQTYKVSLTGITGTAGVPKLLGSTATIPFNTFLIAPVTQSYSFAGVSLTDPVTISFEGPGSFSTPKTTFTAAEVMAGQTINVTYRGAITPRNEDAVMVIKSGTLELRVPLKGVTSSTRPDLRELRFETNPPGAAFLDLSLAGPIYEFGSAITVEVFPETGFYIRSWSDNAGSSARIRTIRISHTTPDVITVNLAVLGCDPVTDPNCGGPIDADGFVAYTPAAGITTDGFPASWSNAKGDNPNGYTVRVYNKNNVLVGGSPINAGMANAIGITGLEPANPTQEDDFFFWYEVTTTTDDGLETTKRVGPIRLLGTIPFTCGE
jgi:hypothetical protein